MNFHLSEMQQMLVDTARRFVAAESGLDQWRDRHASPDGVDQRLWSAMAEMGWLALTVPEDAGGLGGSQEDVALLMIELGKGLVIEPLVSTGIVAAHILDQTMSGEMRQMWLQHVATGAFRIAFAQNDAQLSGQKPLTVRKAGEDYVLDGHKVMVFDAPSANHLIVLAEFEGEPALFIIDAHTSGLAFNNYPLIDGVRASDIHFDMAIAPAAAFLKKGPEVLDVVEAALDRARLALVAQAVGAMDATVQITADYARERRQFGQSIGKFQAIQHFAADMFVAAYQARSALYAALQDAEAAPQVRSCSIAVAKLISGMAGQTVSQIGVQIHGGYGIADEYAVSHYYRRLLALEKQYGGIDAQSGVLAAAEARA